MKCPLNENDFKEIAKMIEQWHEYAEGWESEFSLKNVQALEKATYHWFIKFQNADVLPKAIVALLMSVFRFAMSPFPANKEIYAAMLTAQSICKVLNYDNITDEKSNDSSKVNSKIEVRGATKTHMIDTDAFDLTELIDDVRLG